MKASDHIAAHVNGLKSSIHALEVQLTILKQLCGSDVEAESADAGEQPESDENEEAAPKPARKRGRPAKVAAPAFEDEEAEETTDEEESTDDSEGFEEKPAKRPAKKTASFDDDEEAEENADEEIEDDEPAPAKKAQGKGKAAKVTLDMVNDACKERAARTTRAEVIGLLKKQFHVKSVTELDPKVYADVIKAMKR